MANVSDIKPDPSAQPVSSALNVPTQVPQVVAPKVDQQTHQIAAPILGNVPNPAPGDGDLPTGAQPLNPPLLPPNPAVQQAVNGVNPPILPHQGAAAPTVTTPAAAVPVTTPAPAPINVVAIQANADTQNKNKALYGQEILKGLIKDLKDLNVGTVSLSSKIETHPDGSYVYEAYTISDFPGETFYKTKAIYTLTVTDPTGHIHQDANGKDLVIQITRDIYTLGKTEKQCLILASNLKNTIVGLAKAENGMENRLFTKEEYQGLDATKQAMLMKQGVFRFLLQTDVNTGEITKLNEIIAEKDKSPSISMKLKPKNGHYVQYVEKGTYKKAQFVKPGEDTGPVAGKVVYATKEEAIQHATVKMKHENIFDSLKAGLIAFDKLKEEREKRESDLAALRKTFEEKTAFFGLWGGKSLKPAFSQFLELSKVKQLIEHHQPLPTTMSDKVSQYAADYKSLRDKKAKIGDHHAVDALLAKLIANNKAALNDAEKALYKKLKKRYVAKKGTTAPLPTDKKLEIEAIRDYVKPFTANMDALEKGIEQISKTINAESAQYNAEMLKFEKQQQEYEVLYNQYKDLKQAAADPKNQNGPENLAWAQKIESETSDKYLKKMEGVIQENRKLIKAFEDALSIHLSLSAGESHP